MSTEKENASIQSCMNSNLPTNVVPKLYFEKQIVNCNGLGVKTNKKKSVQCDPLKRKAS